MRDPVLAPPKHYEQNIRIQALGSCQVCFRPGTACCHSALILRIPGRPIASDVSMILAKLLLLGPAFSTPLEAPSTAFSTKSNVDLSAIYAVLLSCFLRLLRLSSTYLPTPNTTFAISIGMEPSKTQTQTPIIMPAMYLTFPSRHPSPPPTLPSLQSSTDNSA